MIGEARQRVLLAALYLQDERQRRTARRSVCRQGGAPGPEIAVFVDWHRAQRGLIEKLPWPAMRPCNGDGATPRPGINIYGVPVQRREFMGVMHLKGFIIDDTVLYSGASLNDVYLHRHQRYRLDRYHVIRSRRLADSMSVVLDRTLRHSSAVHPLNTPSAPKTAESSGRHRPLSPRTDPHTLPLRQ